MATDNSTIHVKLLNEGTDVYRPVEALFLGNGCYQLKGFDIFDPNDEEWEFLPGSVVTATTKDSDDKLILIASSQCVTRGNII